MGCIFSLFFAELRRYWSYYVITIFGVAAAVTGVVWTYGSFSTAENQHKAYGKRLLGAYDFIVGTSNPYAARRRGGPPKEAREKAGKPPKGKRGETGGAPKGRRGGRGGRPGSGRQSPEKLAAWAANVAFPITMAWLREQKNVEETSMAYVTTVVLRNKRPWTGPPLSANIFAIDPATFTPPADLPDSQWLPTDNRADSCIVIDRQQADRLQAKIGDHIGVTGPGSQIQLEICGISEATRPFGKKGNVFITLPTVRRIIGKTQQPAPNLALVKLASREAESPLLENLREQAKDLQIIDAASISTSLKGGRRAMVDMRKWVIVLSLLASLLIVFTTLNMGLAKRLRQFGILRAIGTTRPHLALFLFLEGCLTGSLGTVLGLGAGTLLLLGTVARNPALFPNGIALGQAVFVWAGICGLGGALGAALLPACTTIRQSPLMMLNNDSAPSPKRKIALAAFLGILLLLPALTLSLPIEMTAATRGKYFGIFGLPGILLGGILSTPFLVVLVGRISPPLLGLLFRLPASLVGAELSRHLGRSVAVAMALAAGFGSFVAVSTWGATMLKPFLPTADCPDLAVTFRPDGLPPEAVEEVQTIPLFKQCLPVYTRQFLFGPKTRADIERNALIKSRVGGAILVGVDPEKALLGDDPLFAPNLLNGSPEKIIPLLKTGNYCLAPSSFTSQAGLKVGDEIELGAPADPGIPGRRTPQAPRLTIAGIYTTPWHLLTKKAGMRGLHGSGANVQAMLLVSESLARPLMRDKRLTTFWANYTNTGRQMPTGERIDALNETFVALTKAAGPADYVVPQTGEKIHLESSWANIGDMQFVIDGIHVHAGNIITGMARLPLWSLAVAAIALANTIMTSMRVRRWSLGVMRSVGLTRSQLLRLVFAEALLIGICGCTIGLLGGLYSGWITARMSHYLFHFSGITIEMQIPWSALAQGILIALGAMLAAALVPAFRIARQHPLDLLHEGRMSL